MAKKILLQINVTANWGSTGKIAEQIGLLAMQQGWDSYIAYGRMMNPSKSKLIKIGTQWDVYLHYALGRFFDMEGLASRRATRMLVNDIERIKPDVVHLHNIHDHYLNYPILFEYLAANNIPVVWTQHDQWATTGHCAYNIVDCERWKKECHDCPVKERWVLDKSKRNYGLKKKWFTSVKTLTIVAVSDWLKLQIAQSFLGTYPIEVIKNGVDTNVFKPQDIDIRKKYDIGDKKMILGVASVWTNGKGLDDFIKLSVGLPEGWVIVLVGAMSEVELPLNIIHIERTQNQIELAQICSAANVLVSLSASETFGLTVAEGMACGTPAVVYNNTAFPELVTEITGVVINNGDIDELLKHLKTFEVKTDATVAACKKKAQEFFDKNKSYDGYIRQYSELVVGRKCLRILLGVAHPWSERKGLKDYVSLSRQLPDDCVIVLVGLNEIQRKSLPENIIGLGVTQNVSELVMLYNMADIVLNLSYAETFGLTTAEGFACGTPGIVYNATASPELITPKTGMVVKTGNVDGVAEAVKEMLDKGKNYYSAACRERAEQYFNKDKCFEKCVALYNSLVHD